MGDPFEKELCNTLLKKIEDYEAKKTSILGRLIVELLEKAENGGFK